MGLQAEDRERPAGTHGIDVGDVVLRPALDSLRAEVDSVKVNLYEPGQLVDRVRDLEKRLDTLQTPLWRRAWFRLDGWPGIRDLNAPRRAWRPWHRRN